MSEHHTLSTTLVHAGRKKRFTQGAVNPVVQRASSLVFETIADKKTLHKKSLQGRAFLWASWHVNTLRTSRFNV